MGRNRRQRRRQGWRAWTTRATWAGVAGFFVPVWARGTGAQPPVVDANWWCAGLAALLVLLVPVGLAWWRTPRPGRVVHVDMRQHHDPGAGLARGHVLYRLFDHGGRLLYVGLTNHPSRRFAQHSGRYTEHRRKPWWDQVDHATLTYYATRPDLVVAEVQAITREKPMFNIAHNRRRVVAR